MTEISMTLCINYYEMMSEAKLQYGLGAPSIG